MPTTQWTWRTPVTDRADWYARMRYTDMNRITQNINYLVDYAADLGFSIVRKYCQKSTWIQNDIISVAEWSSLLERLNAVANAVGYKYEGTAPSDWMNYQNINNIEKMTLGVYTTLTLAERNHLPLFVGDNLFAGDGFHAAIAVPSTT